MDKKEGKVLRVFSSGRWLPHALLLIAAGTSVRRALGTASRVTVHGKELLVQPPCDSVIGGAAAAVLAVRALIPGLLEQRLTLMPLQL